MRPDLKLPPISARSLRMPRSVGEEEESEGAARGEGEEGGGARKLATPRSCRPMVWERTERSSRRPSTWEGMETASYWGDLKGFGSQDIVGGRGGVEYLV